MKRFKLVLIEVLLLLLPATAFAAGYGQAGCGLGSIVLGSEPGVKQVFAATTNGTFGSQTFGITSGTSNCGDHGLVNLSKEREVFAQQNYTSLVKEMAQGEGENLETLASLYQCPAGSHAEFAAMTQEKFDRLVVSNQTTSDQLLALIGEELALHPKLAGACNTALNVASK